MFFITGPSKEDGNAVTFGKATRSYFLTLF